MADSNVTKCLDKIYEEGVSDETMARLFHALYKDKCMYDPGVQCWFMLNEFGIWKEEGEEFYSGRLALGTIVKELIAHDHVSRVLTPAAATVMKTYSAIIKYIGSSKSNDNFCKHARTVFLSPKAFQRMDTVANHVFAFNNGVYDLHKGKFRKAKPEEMVSTTCGYNYTHPNKKDVDDVYRFIASIFTVPDERLYVLAIFALQLSGERIRDAIYMLVGSGGNGKSILLDLLRNCFGSRGYYGSMSSCEFMASKYSEAGRASPELAKNKTSRVLIVSELKTGVKLDADKMKVLTGTDEISARYLNKNPFDFVPSFALFFVTNFAPEIDGGDGGLARRLNYIHFRSVFKKNPDYEKGEQLEDHRLKAKVEHKSWGMAFFHILAHTYATIQKANFKFPVPDLFLSKTKSFLAENDPIGLFMSSGRVAITKSAQDKVKASELLEMVHEFGSVNAKQLKTVLEDRYGIKQKRAADGVYYLRLKVNEQIDDGDDDEVEESGPVQAAKIDVSMLEFAGIDYVEEEDAPEDSIDEEESEDTEEEEPPKKVPSKKTREVAPKKLPKKDDTSSAPSDDDEEEPAKPVPKKQSQQMNASFGLMKGHIISGEKLLNGEQKDEEEVAKPQPAKKTPVKKAPAKKVTAAAKPKRGGFSNSDLSFDDDE